MKKITVFSILMLALFSLSVNGQVQFQKTFGSSGSNPFAGNYVQQTSDGGYIMIGTADNLSPDSSLDISLIKTDSIGNIIWSKIFSTAYDKFPSCVQQTTDGGYIISGNTNSNGPYSSGFLIKTNSNGDTVWTKTYESEINSLSSVRQTTDGGYIACGHVAVGAPYGFGLMLKVDAYGNVIWSKKYGAGTSTDDVLSFYQVEQTTDGGYVTSVNGACSNCPCILLKLDSNGDTVWTKTYGPFLWSMSAIQKTSTDGGYLLGSIYNDGTTGYTALIKVDAYGNVIWDNVFEISYGQVKHLLQTSDGGYLALINSGDNFLLKINESGDYVWSKRYQPTAGVYAFKCVQQTTDDGFIVIGNGPQPNSDIVLIKTNFDGISGCNELPFVFNPMSSPIINITSTPHPIMSLSTTTNTFSFNVNNFTLNENTLCSNYSSTNDFVFNENEIYIYPNPVSDIINLEFQSNNEIIEIEIVNLLGQKVLEKIIKTENGENNITLEVKEIPSGVYLLHMRNNNNFFTKKIIKE
jgi:hypothetical protein